MRAERDRGVATVWTASIIAALLCVVGFVYWLGAVVVTRHRAESAADLAALAAAAHAAEGPGKACQRARWVAEGMSVALVTCRWERRDALVEVRSPLPGALARFGPVGARARAGPVDKPP
ncbi:Rv3654c family TadE-like protein [Amycolatopsis sp. H20-H5]|uniref:Rv3654c family TadE-like protein n=1 Tax=Amycolatopsis sp. H20-H5 TaxID=3046309 RepID=UPI002DBE5189|nr:Rv3654c family TadE-like protein [Amycolatopsis sp. H20-H5]MEC3979541.1 Rv3654c family TadE-like protein [Amycolatopsis sp. H20-H5]